MPNADDRPRLWDRAYHFFQIPLVPISHELIATARRANGKITVRRLDNRYVDRIPVHQDGRWLVRDRHAWHELIGARDHEYEHHLRWPGRPSYLFMLKDEEPPAGYFRR